MKTVPAGIPVPAAHQGTGHRGFASPRAGLNMGVQPTITFRGIASSEALASDIHARVARLERFCPDLLSAEVLVELAERHHRDGRRWRVRIDVAVPGEHLIVKNEATLRPDVRARAVETPRKQDASDAGQKHAKVAVRESFETVTRQVQDYVRRRRRGKTEAARRRPAAAQASARAS